MALETNTLVNGAWTTQTLNVNDVLRHYDQQDKNANLNTVEVEKAPVLGLLTQTVIRSPLIHWILPVRLRDSFSNDVALIGVSKLATFLTLCLRVFPLDSESNFHTFTILEILNPCREVVDCRWK